MNTIALTTTQNFTLQSLQRITQQFTQTQTRLNTGRKVNSVVDDAIAYFRAASLTNRATAFQARKAVIDQSIQALTASLSGTAAVSTLLQQLKGVAEAALGDSANGRKSATQQFLNISRQLSEVVKDSSYQGLNLLTSTSATLTTQFSDRTAAVFVINGYNLLATQGNDKTSLFIGSPAVFDSVGNLVFSNLAGLPVIQNPPKSISYNYIQHYQVTGSNTYSRVASDPSSFPATLTFGPSGSIVANPTGGASQYQEFIQNPVTAGSFRIGGFSALDDASEQGQDVLDTYQVGVGLHGSNVLVGQQYSDSASYPNEAARVSGIISERLDKAISQINAISSSLGENIAILKARSAFNGDYAQNLQQGSNGLTLADLNDEAANSQALSLSQQLGIQSLSVSGQQNQSILQLLKS